MSSLLCIVYYGPELFYSCLRLFIMFAVFICFFLTRRLLCTLAQAETSADGAEYPCLVLLLDAGLE